jgi:hypothetical protein
MAGIITISPGHDALYPWRQIGTTAEPGQPPRSATDYYLSPAEKGGEPPGHWHGDGLSAFGFSDNQIIDRAAFEQLYGNFLDPRDPAGQTRLGRMPQQFRSAEEIYAILLALEPEATAERRAELLTEARSQVRTPVQYFDATFSVSKSITLLHASALANAAKTADDGDAEAATYWKQAADTVWAAIQAGNAAALDYLQREAGYTRSGYHGRQLTGISTGRWEDAHGFIIGSFAQHTSRDGDPQLHIHNLILNRVQRERDGAWRTLDSKALHEFRGAAAAIATHVMESALTRDLGVGWIRRADGHGREVAGVSQKLMTQFSSRRQSISALTTRLAAELAMPDTRLSGSVIRSCRSLASASIRACLPGRTTSAVAPGDGLVCVCEGSAAALRPGATGHSSSAHRRNPASVERGARVRRSSQRSSPPMIAIGVASSSASTWPARRARAIAQARMTPISVSEASA